jgi:hypothetical protein
MPAARRSAVPLPPDLNHQFQRGARHLNSLGARATAEFLREIADDLDCWTSIIDRLARYHAITPAMIRAAGGDRFPSTLVVVPPDFIGAGS